MSQNQAGMLKYVSVMGLVGLFCGCGLSLTTMVTSSWLTLVDNSQLGLFYHCSQSVCASINFTLDTSANGKARQSHFKAVRGLVITGLIIGMCGFLTALGFVVDAVRSKGVRSLALLRSSLVLNPLGGVVTILAAAVFAATLYNTPTFTGASLGYSFIVCVVAGSSFLISGILVFVGGPRKVTMACQDRLVIHSHIYEHGLTHPLVAMTCIPPPPSYSPPSEAYLMSLFHPPPEYNDGQSPPPTYEEQSLMPPPYNEEGTPDPS